MKMLVETSVSFHDRNACAMSIHFFFSGEEFEVLIELRYGRWWWEESQSERVSE